MWLRTSGAAVLLAVIFCNTYAQTIDDIIQYIFDHPDDCGDPFGDPIWVPALDLCTKGCDTVREICMEDAELKQRCDPLPPPCVMGLMRSFGEDGGDGDGGGVDSKGEGHSGESSEETTTGGNGDGYTEEPEITDTPAPPPIPETQPPPPEPSYTQAPPTEGYGGGGSGGYGGGDSGPKDYHTWCCKWAAEGQCDQRPKLIRPLCQKSCGTAGCKAEDAENCPVSVSVDPSSCWQLRGLAGNPDRHRTHFLAQPAPYVYVPGSGSGQPRHSGGSAVGGSSGGGLDLGSVQQLSQARAVQGGGSLPVGGGSGGSSSGGLGGGAGGGYRYSRYSRRL